MPNPDAPEVVGYAQNYPPGTRIEAHSHPAHQLAHALSGVMRVAIANRMWVLPVGRAIWIPAGIQHTITCIGAVAMRTAYFSQAYAAVPLDVRMITVSALAREALVRLADETHSPLRHVLATLLIEETKTGATTALSLPLAQNPKILALTAALQNDPANTDSVAAWAKQLGASERSLLRHIRSETGLSFRQLRRQIRILSAFEKLVANQPVSQVAFDVGFQTPSAFIAAFHAITGETPLQFKTARQGGSKR